MPMVQMVMSGASPGIQARDVADGAFVDAADLRGRDRVVLFDQRLERLVAVGVGVDVGLVVQAALSESRAPDC